MSRSLSGRAVPRATEPKTKASRGVPAAWQASAMRAVIAASIMEEG